MLAVAAGYQEVAKCMLAGAVGDSVSVGMSDGTTALHLACGRPGTEQMVGDLLGAGAAPAAADSSGNTPLHLAAAAGAEDAIKRLLAAAAAASCLNSKGELPLHLAIAGGHTAAAVRLIAAAKAPDAQWVNAVSAAGAAPIHLAAVKDLSILLALLKCSALQVGLVDGAGQTALHLAAAGGFVQCIRSLVRAGADRDAVDASGATPLHRLPLASKPQLLALLATPGNIKRVVGGTTLLHTAAAGDSEEVMAALLAAGAAAGTQDSRGECALVPAARHGSPVVLHLLLRHMLWQHKLQQPAGVPLLPGSLVTAVQVALAGREDSISKSMIQLVMEVLGEGAANALWQQLLEQHNSSLAQQNGLPQAQLPQQQQPEQARKQEQLRCQLGDRILTVAVKGFLEAGAQVAQQQRQVTQPLDKAIAGQPRAAAPAPRVDGRQLAAGAVNAAALPAEAAAQPKFVTLEHTTAAARLGQRFEVLRLLQQLPAAVRKDALGAAAQAAADAGHYQLCGQLLQQLVVSDGDAAEGVLQQLGLKTGQGTRPEVKVLGARSLGLCGALLAGWGALRCQQQQELVDSVVSAVVVWKEGQQQVVKQGAGRKRVCPPGRGRVPYCGQQRGHDRKW
jgi:ankyrin repeat protein